MSSLGNVVDLVLHHNVMQNVGFHVVFAVSVHIAGHIGGANELYGQLYDAAEVNTDTLPEDVQQYFTNTVLYQPYLYAQMRGVSLFSRYSSTLL